MPRNCNECGTVSGVNYSYCIHKEWLENFNYISCWNFPGTLHIAKETGLKPHSMPPECPTSHLNHLNPTQIPQIT